MNAIGRNWVTAQNASLTEFVDGDALIRLTWADGEYLVQGFDTHAEARACLKRCGFEKAAGDKRTPRIGAGSKELALAA